MTGIGGPFGPGAVQGAIPRPDGRAQATRLERPGQDEKTVRATCQEFEALFLDLMLQGMRRTVTKSDAFGDRRGEETWQGLQDQELARGLSRSGGIGLADLMLRQLLPQPTPPAAGAPAAQRPGPAR